MIFLMPMSGPDGLTLYEVFNERESEVTYLNNSHPQERYQIHKALASKHTSMLY